VQGYPFAVAVAPWLVRAVDLELGKPSHLQPSDSVRAGRFAYDPAYNYGADYSGRERKVVDKDYAPSR